jgi:hypothetical protein
LYLLLFRSSSSRKHTSIKRIANNQPLLDIILASIVIVDIDTIILIFVMCMRRKFFHVHPRAQRGKAWWNNLHSN